MRSASVLTGVILLTAIWALIQEPPPLASCRLSDGSILRLEAVSRGPVHRFKNGPYWQRLLARVPLPSLRALAGDPIQEIRGATPDSLVFWTTQEVPIGISGASAEVVNEQGCYYGANSPKTTIMANRLLEGWEATAAPRRGRKLGLRVRMFESSYDLMTANPWPGPYPEWKPEQLPVKKQNGPLGVALTSLVTGLEILGTSARTFPMNPVLSEAHIRLACRGKPSVDWMPVGVTLRDPTGNLLTTGIDSLDQHEDKEAFQFTSAFCADEPIWKLRLELAPCTLASIDPADVWTIPSLPLPRPRVFSRTTAHFSRHGVTVRLRGIAGSWRSCQEVCKRAQAATLSSRTSRRGGRPFS